VAKFKDSAGQEWEIRFTVGDLERVKEDADFDIEGLVARPDGAAAALFQAPRKIAQVLWVLCEDQARALGIDPRAFGRRLDREALDAATNALLEAILLFFPRSSAGRAIQGRLPELLRKMDAEIEAAVAREMERSISSTPATTSPASPASTPAG
jgi:hypothetical protein